MRTSHKVTGTACASLCVVCCVSYVSVYMFLCVVCKCVCVCVCVCAGCAGSRGGGGHSLSELGVMWAGSDSNAL